MCFQEEGEYGRVLGDRQGMGMGIGIEYPLWEGWMSYESDPSAALKI